jgi:hypothetical protein
MAGLAEGLVQPLDERTVLTGVGEEDVGPDVAARGTVRIDARLHALDVSPRSSAGGSPRR